MKPVMDAGWWAHWARSSAKTTEYDWQKNHLPLIDDSHVKQKCQSLAGSSLLRYEYLLLISNGAKFYDFLSLYRQKHQLIKSIVKELLTASSKAMQTTSKSKQCTKHSVNPEGWKKPKHCFPFAWVQHVTLQACVTVENKRSTATAALLT